MGSLTPEAEPLRIRRPKRRGWWRHWRKRVALALVVVGAGCVCGAVVAGGYASSLLGGDATERSPLAIPLLAVGVLLIAAAGVAVSARPAHGKGKKGR